MLENFKPSIRPMTYDPPQDPLCVVHRDDDLLVLNKPSGLLSVPGRRPEHHDCLENRAKAAFPQALLTHRLDCDTSGLMLMAMNKRAQSLIGKHFERRLIHKTYIARVAGSPKEDEGFIDLPLRCDWPNRPLQMVCYEHGKPSQTAWKVLERGGDSTLVQLNPITGRSHQLRVHMLALGHPILGECFYAPEEVFRASPRLLLHAHSLEIHHPEGGKRVQYSAETPF